MDSDDDYQTHSPPKDSSPPLQLRKLKRLKKSISVPNDPPLRLLDDLLSIPRVDFAQLEALEASGIGTLGSDDSNEPFHSPSPSQGFDDDNELNSGFDGLHFDEDRSEHVKVTKRALEFDDMVVEFDGNGKGQSGGVEKESVDSKVERLEKERINNGELKENKESSRSEYEKVTRRVLDFDDAVDEFDGHGKDRSGGVEKESVDSKVERLEKERINKGELKEKKENSRSEYEKLTKRVLEFDDAVDEFDGRGKDQSGGVEKDSVDSKMERSEKKRNNKGELKEKKEKKKRVKSVDDDTKPLNKRREAKERKAHLQQLHAESQRLLRETRDAAFKPIPVVHKPISSILERIRQRKLEMSKKSVFLNNNSSIAENNGSLREVIMELDPENVPIEKEGVEILEKTVEEETVFCHVDVETSLDASHMDGSKGCATQSSHENVPSQMGLDEETTHPFRAPVDDTQDLFGDSQTSDSKDGLDNDQQHSPPEEVLAPSLLAINLKFDSAPPDDSSSDEEDNDKENIDPRPHKFDSGCSSPKGDPVKAFVDDEAMEEDDSDNDLFRFQENEEDEDNEDFEELNDMIATEYEEKPIDNDKRNELHQKWLEQQDAAGTDNLLQRLNYGSKHIDTTLLDEEEQEYEDEEGFNDESEEDVVPKNLARVNSRKAKQMITHMFSDKDDAYLSDGDEETEKMLVKQRLLVRAEEHATLLSPAEDESSREVFGLIKKLNIVSDTKKKSKPSSFFDTVLSGGNSNGSSKSSFLGRVSNHPLPSSRKQGSSTIRSYIFGRDESNSRSSISISDDSSDTISIENRQTKNVKTKFANSQAKFSSQRTNSAAGTESGISLFEILKRSSMQSDVCDQNSMVGSTQTFFAAFKIPKKPIKIEGRR